LAFHPENTPLDHLPVTTGLTDIRQIAVSRLMLDNFAHIKAYWQMMTPKIAQIALRFGADDLDGTVIEEKIYHDAGATTPQGMTRKELCRLITEAGRIPVERDTLYNPVTRTEDSFVVAVLWIYLRHRLFTCHHVFHLPWRISQGCRGFHCAGAAEKVHAGS
jgi:aminodeoxyfutalosine synthase